MIEDWLNYDLFIYLEVISALELRIFNFLKVGKY